jgi:hypothetical protein
MTQHDHKYELMFLDATMDLQDIIPPSKCILHDKCATIYVDTCVATTGGALCYR